MSTLATVIGHPAIELLIAGCLCEHRQMRSACLAFIILLGSAPAPAATPAEEARIELTTYAALYGAGLGAFTALELDLNLRPALWLTAGLTTAAIWGTWEAAAARDLQPNQTALITSAAGWTMVETLLVSGVFRTGQGVEKAIWLTFGTGALAAGAAYWAAPGYTTSIGDLSLINSGGLWMPVATTLLLMPVIEEVVDDPFIYLIVTTGLGLGLGALVADAYQPSRTQVLYMDAGLGIGLLGGGMVGLMGAIVTESEEVGAYLALAGMVTGGLIAVQQVGFSGGREAVEPTTMALRRREPVPLPLWVGVW